MPECWCFHCNNDASTGENTIPTDDPRPSAASVSTRAYRYQPLDHEKPTFRLFRLFASGHGLAGEIFEAHLDDSNLVSYEALSYTWGERWHTGGLIINETPFKVTRNLLEAVSHLQLDDQDRILWIDAICIDQSNDRERGHQVQQMRHIYSRANQVLIWLGIGNYGTGILMDSLKLLHEISLDVSCTNWLVTDARWLALWSTVQEVMNRRDSKSSSLSFRAFHSLLDHTWFSRVWILQEVAMARAALVYSGQKFVSARIFALLPALLKTTAPQMRQAVLDIMPGPSRNFSWWSQDRTLYNLLRKFKESNASDPRDKIFALLGMCDSSDGVVFRPNYEKSMQEVMCDLQQALFPGSSSDQRKIETVQELVDKYAELNDLTLLGILQSPACCNVEWTSAMSFLEYRGLDLSFSTGAVSHEFTLRAMENNRLTKVLSRQFIEVCKKAWVNERTPQHLRTGQVGGAAFGPRLLTSRSEFDDTRGRANCAPEFLRIVVAETADWIELSMLVKCRGHELLIASHRTRLGVTEKYFDLLQRQRVGAHELIKHDTSEVPYWITSLRKVTLGQDHSHLTPLSTFEEEAFTITLLDLASTEGHLQAVSQLLFAGATVHGRDVSEDGSLPGTLFGPALWSDGNVLRILLLQGQCSLKTIQEVHSDVSDLDPAIRLLLSHAEFHVKSHMGMDLGDSRCIHRLHQGKFPLHGVDHSAYLLVPPLDNLERLAATPPVPSSDCTPLSAVIPPPRGHRMNRMRRYPNMVRKDPLNSDRVIIPGLRLENGRRLA